MYWIFVCTLPLQFCIYYLPCIKSFPRLIVALDEGLYFLIYFPLPKFHHFPFMRNILQVYKVTF